MLRGAAFGSRTQVVASRGPATLVIKSRATVPRMYTLMGVRGTLNRGYSSYPAHTQLLLPSLSPTMEQGDLISWAKKEGDQIKAGHVIAKIETDKAAMEFEATEADEGFLAKILVEAGTSNLKVGTPIAILTSKAANVAAFKDYKAAQAASEAVKPAAAAAQQAAPAPQQQAAPTPAPAAAPTPAPAAAAAPQQHSTSDVQLSPAVLNLVNLHKLNPAQITGTGPKGRILKGDVLEFVAKGGSAAPAATSAAQSSSNVKSSGDVSYEDIPNSNIRKVIAARLTESKTTIPHVYISQDFSISQLMKTRASLNAATGQKISVNDFLVKAAGLALRQVPAANASWDVKTGAIVEHSNVDISVAVATDKGLITPIVKQADALGLGGISSTTKKLAGKARDGTLKPEEFIGGTFTISNLGMFGIKEFSAVINPPQGAILAVSGAQQRVTLNEKTGAPEVTQVLNATLSFDGRAIADDAAAEFMQTFGDLVANPTRMLI